jgi:hypothetical protein
MSTHAYCNQSEVIVEEIVDKICSVELENLKQVLDKYDLSLQELSTCTQYQGEDIEAEIEIRITDTERSNGAAEIYKAYRELCDKFNKETDLDLWLNYHSAEGRGDEVDGHFWCVGGALILSPAAEKLNEKFKTNENPYPVETKSWITYG